MLGDGNYVKFYELNLMRNDIFVKNVMDGDKKVFDNVNNGNVEYNGYQTVLDKMSKFREIEVVVTGGFHSEVVNMLKEQKVSYLAITPNVTKNFDEKVYNKVLAGKITPIDVLASAFAPVLLSVVLKYVNDESTVQNKNIEPIIVNDALNKSETIDEVVAGILATAKEGIDTKLVKKVNEKWKNKVIDSIVDSIDNKSVDVNKLRNDFGVGNRNSDERYEL